MSTVVSKAYMFQYLSGGFPLVLLVLLLGMGIGGSGEDTSYRVSELGSDTKILSSGLLLTVIVEGLSLSIEGSEGAIGVIGVPFKIGYAGTKLTFCFTNCFGR